jgi:hypothetical protein
MSNGRNQRSLDQPEILKCEMEALKRLHAAGLDNVSSGEIPFTIKFLKSGRRGDSKRSCAPDNSE